MALHALPPRTGMIQIIHSDAIPSISALPYRCFEGDVAGVVSLIGIHTTWRWAGPLVRTWNKAAAGGMHIFNLVLSGCEGYR